MANIKVNIKKLVKEAVIPSYAKENDAGMDLVATSVSYDEYGNIVYGTGLAFEIPEGYVGLLFPRSSNSKTNLYLTNSVGVIDSGYRGEVILKFQAIHHRINYLSYILEKLFPKFFEAKIRVYPQNKYEVGHKVGQIIILPYPQIEFLETKELSKTKRGKGGFGSTGK